MEENPLEHTLYRILNAKMSVYPFSHLIIDDIFPSHYYKKILQFLPSDDAYDKIWEVGRVAQKSYPERSLFLLNDACLGRIEGEQKQFWEEFTSWILSDKFRDSLIAKFSKEIHQRFGEKAGKLRYFAEAELVRDLSGYALGAHTDTPEKLMTLLFYLPETSDYRERGTSIFVPKDPEKMRSERSHHDLEEFNLVTTAPYVPNSFFGFLRTNHSWHGVYPITEKAIIRNSLCYRINITNLATL